MRMHQQGSIIEKPLIERGKQVPGLIESLQATVPPSGPGGGKWRVGAVPSLFRKLATWSDRPSWST